MYDKLQSVSAITVFLSSMSTLLFNVVIIVTYMNMSGTLRHDMTNMSLFNQAFADITIVVPSTLWAVYSYYLLVRKLQKWPLQLYTMVFLLYSLFAVYLSLLATVMNIFLSIKFPLKWRKITARTKIIAVVFCTWAFPTIPPTVCYYLVTRSFHEEYFKFVKWIICLLIILVAITLLTLVITFKELRSAVRHQRTLLISATSYETNETTYRSSSNKHDRRLILYLIIVVPAYAVTMTPDLILNLICYHVGIDNQEGHPACDWTSITFILYSLFGTINPLLTILFREDFKQARRWMTLDFVFTRSVEGDNNNVLTEVQHQETIA